MASIGLEACFSFVSGHTHDVPGWYLGCIEDMHRCRPQAVVCILLAEGSLLAKDRHHRSCKWKIRYNDAKQSGKLRKWWTFRSPFSVYTLVAFWTHHCAVKPCCSNFRIITVMIWMIKGVGSWTCRISLVNRQKIEVVERKWHIFFCVPNISTFMNRTYSPVLILFSCVIACWIWVG